MPTWLPSSKKCSTAKVLLCLASALATGTTAYAALDRSAATAPPSRELLNQITSSVPNGNFEPLLGHWQRRYGGAAVPSLFQLAGQSGVPDPQRYVALMGAARLGGRVYAPRVAAFLHDPSWLLRSGALRALSALGDPATSIQVLPLLQDASLAVRVEAVTATSRLRPPGAAAALLRALASPDNYRAGKALWLPGRALAALAAMRASQAATSLRPLLDHERDPDLQIETVAALEALTDRHVASGAPLAERVRRWKLELSRR